MTCLADLSNPSEDNKDESLRIISVVTSFDTHHVAHTSLLLNGKRTVYNRVSHVVTNKQLSRDIQRMIKFCGGTKGVGAKIRQQHRKKHSEIEFSESVIRNTITRIR